MVTWAFWNVRHLSHLENRSYQNAFQHCPVFISHFEVYFGKYFRFYHQALQFPQQSKRYWNYRPFRCVYPHETRHTNLESLILKLFCPPSWPAPDSRNWEILTGHRPIFNWLGMNASHIDNGNVSRQFHSFPGLPKAQDWDPKNAQQPVPALRQACVGVTL